MPIEPVLPSRTTSRTEPAEGVTPPVSCTAAGVRGLDGHGRIGRALRLPAVRLPAQARAALALLVLVGVVGALLIGRSSTRPTLTVLVPVTVPDAYAGTTYAFDGLVCLQAGSIGARVSGVEASTAAGVRTEVALRPPGAPPSVAFPVDASAADPFEGVELAGGDERWPGCW